MKEFAFGYSEAWPELMVAAQVQRDYARVRLTAEGGFRIERTGERLWAVLDELRAILREKGIDLSQVEPAFDELVKSS